MAVNKTCSHCGIELDETTAKNGSRLAQPLTPWLCQDHVGCWDRFHKQSHPLYALSHWLDDALIDIKNLENPDLIKDDSFRLFWSLFPTALKIIRASEHFTGEEFCTGHDGCDRCNLKAWMDKFKELVTKEFP